ncbi:MAG TPA: Ldh family oxidoreductase [Candidatus Saccharimonadales bacterium]|nr:Ldh family oxidoreductase [Candidatus Saccharimonadales bacterium]
MKLSISEVTDKMKSLLESKNYSDADIPFLINMYLGGELRGHTSHGLASFPGFVKENNLDLDQPEAIKTTDAFFLIDAKGNNGTLIGKHATDEAIARAKKQVVGFSMIKNMDSWLRPGAIAQYVAEQGFLAIVVNSGGGAAIAPPGGFDPVVGTNPIAYAIPTEDGPLVVDMATSKRAWGQVRLANKYGTDLPPDTFYDNEGNVTLDPKKAWSVMPFGEYKGFSLALLFEMMCGSLVGMDMMIDSNSGNKFGQKMPERGAFIFVVDPEQTTGLDNFKKANSDYIQKIRATRPRKGEQIRVPGEQAGDERTAKLKEGAIDIPDELWEEIKSL